MYPDVVVVNAVSVVAVLVFVLVVIVEFSDVNPAVVATVTMIMVNRSSGFMLLYRDESEIEVVKVRMAVVDVERPLLIEFL